MAVSEARRAANRRNAEKSTGPRTEAGKERAKFNAVKHGMRAETLVLPSEDPQALEARRAAWYASLAPTDDVEASAVDDAIASTWMQDRARRAQAARIAANIANAGVDEAKREADQVLRLGQKLFADNRGFLATYPHRNVQDENFNKRDPQHLVSHSYLVDDPEDPPRIVLHLQSTLGGCQWMLERWAELRSILTEGLDWQSVDKLKAIRLLGKQPIEAADDRTVLTLFVACRTMEGKPVTIIPEIWKELHDYERKPYAERLLGRGVEKLAPANAEAARQVLLGIIDRATAQIEVKAADHRRRAAILDALAVDCLAFDDSPEGERLRRYELASGRGVSRALDRLIKLRHMDRPAANGCDECAAADEPNATNEPTVIVEIATNEATAAEPQTRRGASKTALPRVTVGTRPNATAEPTAVEEIAANEATATDEIATNEATVIEEIAANEATATDEIATNEATAVEEIAANEATATDEIATNEATAVEEIAANEATATVEIATNEATVIEEIAANEATPAAQRDFPPFKLGLDFEEAGELLRETRELRKEIRAEKLRYFKQYASDQRAILRDANRSRGTRQKNEERRSGGHARTSKSRAEQSRNRDVEAQEQQELERCLGVLKEFYGAIITGGGRRGP